MNRFEISIGFVISFACAFATLPSRSFTIQPVRLLYQSIDWLWWMI